jgi:predicted Rossmann-fold nucleotide-binding protein
LITVITRFLNRVAFVLVMYEQKYTPGLYTIPELSIGKFSLKDVEVSVLSERPFPRDRIIVGIMGSAGKEPDRQNRSFEPDGRDRDLGDKIGKIIAEKGAITSNGAAWGIPYFNTRAANRVGGYTMGISPFKDKKAHESKNPTKHLDLIIYVGAADEEDPTFDFMLRDALNTRYPEIVISIGGRWGTLDEDSQALDQGRVFIPIKGTGGATDILVDAIENKKIEKDFGAKIITPQHFDDIERCIDEGILEAKSRWEAEGRTQNLFSRVIDELEKVMPGY